MPLGVILDHAARGPDEPDPGHAGEGTVLHPVKAYGAKRLPAGLASLSADDRCRAEKPKGCRIERTAFQIQATTEDGCIMRVLIKGSGVAGLCLAHELVSRGASVTIIEPNANFSKSASWLAGGMLAPWCERENAEDEVLQFGKRAAAWWQDVMADEVCLNGTLVVAPPRDSKELTRFASRTSGYDWIDGPQIADLEPDLEGRFTKGLFFDEEAHLDPRKVLMRLKGDLIAKGVVFVESEVGAERDVDVIADCTGMASRNTDLRGVRGEMLILKTSEVLLSRPVRMLHPRIPIYIVPREDNHFMVGATMIESEDDGPISARSTMELLNAAYSLHPAFAEAKIVETGTGVRPAYHDNLPRIEVKGRDLSLNGFYRHGFLLAPHYAEQAAETLYHAITDQSQSESCLEPHN